MTLQDFRSLVRKEFGGDLRHMTPSNVRDFLARVQPRVEGSYTHQGRLLLNEKEGSYESIIRDFLGEVLEMPAEQAVIRLWLYSLELTLENLSEVEAEKFRKLFATLASDGFE